MITPYGTIEEADEYFGERLYAEIWTLRSEDDQLKAMKQMTEIINRLNFVGCMTDEDQENQFPRDGDTEVPRDIRIATYEGAAALLDGVDPEAEMENLGVTGQGYSSVRVSYGSRPYPEHTKAGVPSAIAWRYLRPYLRSDVNINMKRMN